MVEDVGGDEDGGEDGEEEEQELLMIGSRGPRRQPSRIGSSF